MVAEPEANRLGSARPMEELPPTPSTVLAAYAQTFVDGRKVVVFGDCTSGLAERLVERGARLVHVYDSDLTRVAEAAARGSSSNIAYAPLGQSGIAVRDGAFDVGIIENLALAEDAPALMTRLRRALAARGVALVVAPNPDVDPVLFPDAGSDEGPSYYDLYEIVSREFDEVRMVGQTPFVGYALADFTPGAADEFSIDTGFVSGGAEEPDWYVAVASHFPVSIDPYSVVQLQAVSVLAASGEPGESQAEALEEAQGQIAQLEKKLARAERMRSDDSTQDLLVQTKAELEKRDAWVAELEARAAAADERADKAEDQIEAAKKRSSIDRQQAEQASARVAELEAALESAEQRLRGAESRLESADKREREAQQRLAAAADELRNLEGGAREQSQERVATLEQQLARLEAKLADAYDKSDRLQAKLDAVDDEQAALQTDIEAAEAQLRERAGLIAEQRRDIARLEALAAQLLADLEAAREPAAPSSVETDGSVGAASDLADADASGLEVSSVAAFQDPVEKTTEASSGDNGASGPTREELEANLDELAQVDAKRVADLTAAQWTVAELEGKLADQEQQARTELEQLRAELQQKVALLHQLQNAPPR